MQVGLSPLVSQNTLFPKKIVPLPEDGLRIGSICREQGPARGLFRRAGPRLGVCPLLLQSRDDRGRVFARGGALLGRALADVHLRRGLDRGLLRRGPGPVGRLHPRGRQRPHQARQRRAAAGGAPAVDGAHAQGFEALGQVVEGGQPPGAAGRQVALWLGGFGSLVILGRRAGRQAWQRLDERVLRRGWARRRLQGAVPAAARVAVPEVVRAAARPARAGGGPLSARSEERRVGKECLLGCGARRAPED